MFFWFFRDLSRSVNENCDWVEFVWDLLRIMLLAVILKFSINKYLILFFINDSFLIFIISFRIEKEKFIVVDFEFE